MIFSKRIKYLLIGLLIGLNIIIRIPSVPHEIGNDSAFIHVLANSISLFGEARWWIHPLSIFGLYPYSYASSVPFLLSGLSQCTGIDMEWTIWLFCLITGVFTMFATYILAGRILDDDVFKFFVAFIYSLSPGILFHSTWNASTRGLFTIFLPLFLYLLLKIHNCKCKSVKTKKGRNIKFFGVFRQGISPNLRYIILTFVLFLLLFSIHHYVYLTIPIIFVYVIFFLTFNKIKGYIKPINIPISNIIAVTCFLIMLIYPFFTRIFISAGSRYDWLNMMVNSEIRYNGILVIFSIGGLLYILLKNNKNFEEWFFLSTLIVFLPILYLKTYAHFFIALFVCLVIGYGLMNISKVHKPRKKIAIVIIIICLLLSVSFSGFYQHWRTHKYIERTQWHMDDVTYVGGVWIKENINGDKRMVGNGGVYNGRSTGMFATCGGKPTILAGGGIDDLTYGFINKSYICLRENSPFEIEFYLGNPYVEESGRSIGGQLNWLSGQSDIDGMHGKRIINWFNLSYMIENTDINDRIMRSVREKKENVYNSGKIRIWILKE